MRPLRIGIDARLSGGHGGVEQVVIGVAGALSKLDDGEEEYLFLVNPGDDEWLRPHLGGPCRILEPGHPPPRRGFAKRISWQLEARLPRRVADRWWPPPTAGYTPEEIHDLGISDGTIESAGVDVMHFLLTLGFLTRVPTIYQPHDLQHLHLPDFFTPREIARRELTYRTFCERAALVVMMTSWGKQDLVARYALPSEKVAVVPWGSVLSNYPTPSPQDLENVRRLMGLPDKFLLFPAQTWPHKNHLGLLDALAVLRDEHGLEVTTVCPGKQAEHFGQIEARVRELGLSGSVRFPGFVTPLELRSLYTTATALIFPSFFEGWGLPVSEALGMGLPVACSAIPSLMDVAGDAALTFDPSKPEEIAASVQRIWTDTGLRASLAERGRKRSERFTFDHTARLFRAHYRRIGGARLTAEDRELLAAPPLA
jgi:glycosyltransferase involved in cell wall biosynthesis